MPKKTKCVKDCGKKSYNDKCIVLIEKIQKLLKEAKSKDKSQKKSKKVQKKSKKVQKRVRKMVGGDNFIKDIQRAGKGVGLSIEHTFNSMSNLGKDMYCESDAIMNIPNELDLGYTQECPFTKTKIWKWSEIKP